MSDEVELVSDGDGLAVLGDPKAVELFLTSRRLESRELGMERLSPLLSNVSAALSAGSALAAGSGRWVQITEQSAELMKTLPLMKGPVDGIVRAQFMAAPNEFAQHVQIIQNSASMLANPAILTGVAGVMAQIAIQQAMDEIVEYLAVIDQKVDDILRAQKDAVLAEMIAVGLLIDDAITVRREVGRVSEVTWSKVQNGPMAIAGTQAYALRQLDSIAEKFEREKNIDELAKLARASEDAVAEWLAVLARCVQLNDALAILELDRVLDSTPEDIDNHRRGLKTARANRAQLIGGSTARLLERMATKADWANANFKVLLNPFSSRAVVHAANSIAVDVGTIHGVLGIEGELQAIEAKKWVEAAEGARDTVAEKGAIGVAAAVRLKDGALEKARRIVNDAAEEVAKRTRPDSE
ncbi:hypothetical protein [Pseudolysinimonas sp.]